MPSTPIPFCPTKYFQPLVNPGAPGGDTPPDKVLNLTFGIGSANADIWVSSVPLIDEITVDPYSLFEDFQRHPI